MSNYETLKSLELQEACNRLKSAMQAQRVEVYASALQRKGKTLYSVNRTRKDTIIRIAKWKEFLVYGT